MIKKAGYPSEIHQIETSDGYILKMHRIPPVMQQITAGKLDAKEKGNKKIAFLMHGLISSSADFVVTGRENALGNY